ncbi:MAG: uroporphyrinogen decarboxylase [Legionellales bacterium]|nr:uroporphyrinogen decarboxylase [Legionellales bacterium]
MFDLINDRLLKALNRQPVDRTPIWIMRQAGRYLPEYRAIREKAGDFMTLCQTPELACEVTLQPLERFDLDAAILFSDILTIPDAMGLGLHFIEGKGPCFHQPIRQARDIQQLAVPDMEQDLGYVSDAVRMIRQALAGKVPLIGFSGSPWTLACYMVEGSSSKGFAKTKSLSYSDPYLMHQLLSILARSVVEYLNAQISAGVQVVMLFDSWGGILTSEAYQQYSLAYMRQIIDDLIPGIPVIVFTKGAGLWLESISRSGCQAIGLDWTTNIGEARVRVGERVALQGNLDPVILTTNPETIQREASRVLRSFGGGNGHIFNLGHGITPDVDPEHVQCLVETVHNYSLSGQP